MKCFPGGETQFVGNTMTQQVTNVNRDECSMSQKSTVLLLQPAPGYFARAVTCQCSPATCHTVQAYKLSANTQKSSILFYFTLILFQQVRTTEINRPKLNTKRRIRIYFISRAASYDGLMPPLAACHCNNSYALLCYVYLANKLSLSPQTCERLNACSGSARASVGA